MCPGFRASVFTQWKMGDTDFHRVNVSEITFGNITQNPIDYEFEQLDDIANNGLYSSETIIKYQKILTSPRKCTAPS